jgi:hypothetical protein
MERRVHEMRCNKCGNLNTVGSAFCMECGAPLGASAAGEAAPDRSPPAPPEQAQPIPKHVPYNPPYPRQAFQPPRVPTVKSIHLGEVLFLIASALLLVAGFENFASLSSFVSVSYVILGFVAIVGGMLFLGMVVMPHVLKPIKQNLDVLVLILSAIYLFWGVAAMFGNGIGFDGGMVFIGGLFGLTGMALRMGIIR